jgi:hypothetical protein
MSRVAYPDAVRTLRQELEEAGQAEVSSTYLRLHGLDVALLAGAIGADYRLAPSGRERYILTPRPRAG